MRYPPHILDEIRARLPVSQVVARKVPLKKKGREFSGLSPFKVEKTPSFFVNDQKGFYHCFASGEHGDIFTFLMKTEGLQFPEAVERLAQEAGVTLPKPDVRDEVREDLRQRLTQLMDTAAAFFEERLKSDAGTEARRYIQKRGLRADTLREFRIGYAPNSRSALKDHLAKAGFTLDEMIASGMLISGDDIPVAYDRFRNRVMFPIADAKGRIIAFGGRALDADAPAKYLNSPETPLFHKGHVLFNAHRARPAAHDKHRVIAVEGYMDVVALAEAGFMESVAPLGTALTEDQLKLLWRMCPEPTLCFDGDSAGKKAAFRAIDVALPHVKPGASLMFAFLPDGLDPDDLIRQQGADAMEGVLAASRPLIDVLFEREWSQGDWSTPERRAGLERQLYTLISRIEDEAVRTHYRREVATRLANAWGGPSAPDQGPAFEPSGSASRTPKAFGAPRNFADDWRSRTAMAQRGGKALPPRGRAPGGRPNPFAQPLGASSALKKSTLVRSDTALPPYREALLLRTILNHPWLIDDHAEAIAAIEFTSPALSRLRDEVLSAQALDISLDTETLRTHLTGTSAGKALTLLERAVSHDATSLLSPTPGAPRWRMAGATPSRCTNGMSGFRDRWRLPRRLGTKTAVRRRSPGSASFSASLSILWGLKRSKSAESLSPRLGVYHAVRGRARQMRPS